MQGLNQRSGGFLTIVKYRCSSADFFFKLENGLLFPATNLRKIHKILKLKSYKSTLTQNFI